MRGSEAWIEGGEGERSIREEGKERTTRCKNLRPPL